MPFGAPVPYRECRLNFRVTVSRARGFVVRSRGSAINTDVNTLLHLGFLQYYTMAASSSCSDANTALVVFWVENDSATFSAIPSAEAVVNTLQAQIDDANSAIHKNATSTVKNAIPGSLARCGSPIFCGAAQVTVSWIAISVAAVVLFFQKQF
jgi:hypothetical protein